MEAIDTLSPSQLKEAAMVAGMIELTEPIDLRNPLEEKVLRNIEADMKRGHIRCVRIPISDRLTSIVTLWREPPVSTPND